LDLAARFAQLLPVAQLRDDLLSLGPNRRSGVTEIAAQLRVGQRLTSGLGKRTVTLQIARTVRHPEKGAHRGFSLVPARISARWMGCAGAFARVRPPPMCIRQDESPAVTYAAEVLVTAASLSVNIAVEVSA